MNSGNGSVKGAVIAILIGLVLALIGAVIGFSQVAAAGSIADLKPIVYGNQRIIQTTIPVLQNDINYIKKGLDRIEEGLRSLK